MSTGKRLAKRSIIGMRVSALCDDGLYYPVSFKIFENVRKKQKFSLNNFF